MAQVLLVYTMCTQLTCQYHLGHQYTATQGTQPWWGSLGYKGQTTTSKGYVNCGLGPNLTTLPNAEKQYLGGFQCFDMEV